MAACGESRGADIRGNKNAESQGEQRRQPLRDGREAAEEGAAHLPQQADFMAVNSPPLSK